MEFENNSTNSFIRNLSHKRTSLNQKMTKLINTTPKRMKGRRANIPPPLLLDPMTPPPTITKQRILEFEFNNDGKDDDDFHMEINTSPSLQLQKNRQGFKSFLKNECCFCEEMLYNKFNKERIIELNCNHQCHYDCYLLLINGEDKEESPICCICEEKTKPIDENIIEEMYSKTLIGDEIEIEPQHKSITPFTPQDKIIDNCNSAGFQTSPKLRYSTPSTLHSISSPKITIDDILKPTINIIPEFNKLNGILESSDVIKFNNVLNIFSTEFNHDEDLEKEYKESLIKLTINHQIIENFTIQIKDNKGLKFSVLKDKLRLFDFIEISLDGEIWEFVQAFIFTNFLLLLNEEGDTIIGTIMINDHFTKLTTKDSNSLIFYFNTVSLPELHIRSLNSILITKWLDFFQNKLYNDDSLSLIQITTNAWELVQDKVDIPDEIIQFNDMTARGLDLPFQLMKSLIPKPKPLGISIVMSISLLNRTGANDDEYLMNLKKAIRGVLNGLRDFDRFGLIIIGRDGNRQLGHFGTFYGLINKKWSGWDEILEELEVFGNYDMTLDEEFKISINTCERLLITIPDLNFKELDIGGVRKFIIINSGVVNGDGLGKILEYKFTIEHVLINEKFDSSVLKMIERMETPGCYDYNFHRFDNFDEFINGIGELYKSWQRIIIPEYEMKFSIEPEMIDIVEFSCIENHGVLNQIKQNEFKVIIKDMDDGYYKNLKFEISINIKKLKEKFQYPINEFIELSLFNYTFNYFSKSNISHFKTNLQLISTPIQEIISPIDTTIGEYLDIPLLPPLSSFKDSLYIKRTIEIMIIETLTQCGDLDELISLIFGLIRGCSSNFINFYKDSKFKKWRNFHDYVDGLINRIRGVDDELTKNQLILELKNE